MLKKINLLVIKENREVEYFEQFLKSDLNSVFKLSNMQRLHLLKKCVAVFAKRNEILLELIRDSNSKEYNASISHLIENNEKYEKKFYFTELKILEDNFRK